VTGVQTCALPICGAVQGQNSAGTSRYTGPCPPTFKHRYFFRLYALDTELPLGEGVPRNEVEAAMENHILEQAELTGLYEKQNK